MSAYRSQVAAPTAVSGGVAAAPIARLSAAPNPFNPRTTLAFTLPQTTDVCVAIFDVAGRQVRNLDAGTLPAGEHRLEWDGRDGSGRALASGTFFARLEGATYTPTVKLQLVR